uniref:Protein kinase domain-containing protein n=1 Tax=Timema tahoe TaxID=61484 RepID=A0A7R9IF87_9NEOP|nr:unnamed protein product [Timema tahoe]
MAKDDDLLPDKDAAKGFYAKYEPKEILGRNTRACTQVIADPVAITAERDRLNASTQLRGTYHTGAALFPHRPEGISSTVRRCIEKETGTEFAAKIIDLSNDSYEGVSEGKTMLEATLEEINILRMVTGHPYIIELHDVFQSNTFIFLVFELCKNGELFDYLTSVLYCYRYIMRQLFEALQYVHMHNIVHRDLKPENILLDDNFNIKLTDFGFAKVLQPNEKLFDLCGTPGYLAPEVLRCNMFEGEEGYGPQIDLWACGVIMFTLLVGCPPFWHRKQMVMLRNIMEGNYSFTSPEWADITESSKDLIRKLLTVDPYKRITIEEALSHQFFQVLVRFIYFSSITREAKKFKKFNFHLP